MSDIEETLAFQMKAYNLDPLRQYKFHPKRKYLADFCIPEHLLIVECNGGTWMAKSGHSTGIGISRDYEKSNCAQKMGYRYLQYTRKEVEDGSAILEILEFLGRCEQ
jgi:very-short-patch-repair endonuclease